MNSSRNVESALGFLAVSMQESLETPWTWSIRDPQMCLKGFCEWWAKRDVCPQIKQQLCFYCQVKILYGIKLKGKRGLAFFFFLNLWNI